MNFGEIEIVEQKGLTSMPQKAASAWGGAMGKIVGADYVPLIYVGEQPVKGVNYIFIAQQTLILATPERHIVLITINEFGGNYTIVGIERII